MATKTAILAVRIVTDATQATQGFDQAATGAQKFGSTLDALTPAAAAAVGAIALVSAKAISAASDLQQASGAVEAVFGTYAEEVKGFADDAARNVGLAEAQYSQLAAVLGAQLKNMGIPMEAVAGQTDELITLGADLAATFGGTTADAVEALSSLLRGERDPIERYGISIKQADIEAQKAAMGLSGLEGEAAKAADTQATLALLMTQSADASGQFARETDSLAGAQQIANASWEDAIAALGESLLPIMTTFAGVAADLAGFIEENATAVTILVGVIGTLAAAVLLVNGAMKAWHAVSTIVTAAQWLWNAAMAANPIGLIIIAIGLLIGIIVLLVQNWDTVKRVAADVWGSVISWIRQVGDWFQSVFAAIGDWWNGLIDDFRRGFDALFGWINDALTWFYNLMGVRSEATSTGGNLNAAAYSSPISPTLLGGTSPYFNQIVPVRNTRAAEPTGEPLNITVTGALDPDAVARQIEQLLTRRNRNLGRVSTAGGMRR